MAVNKTGRKILILGASADMARPFLQILFAEWEACTFYFLARNTSAITDLAAQGRSKGHTVEIHYYDVEKPEVLRFSGVEFCITYTGWLPDDNNAVEKSMLLNFTGIKQFVDVLISDNQQTLKHILFTGSIAGVRIRPANQAYGLAKAALHQYALELQKNWAGKIAITLVIPGFVQTKMIAGMQTPGILTSTPEKLAYHYVKWMGSQPKVVYSQPVWKLISFGLRIVPEFIIKRMKR